MAKTWKEKIGKRLLAHVNETTCCGTLAEFKRNLAAHKESGATCFECMAIADKLGLPGGRRSVHKNSKPLDDPSAKG